MDRHKLYTQFTDTFVAANPDLKHEITYKQAQQ